MKSGTYVVPPYRDTVFSEIGPQRGSEKRKYLIFLNLEN